MIIGLGSDICDIRRIEQVLERHGETVRLALEVRDTGVGLTAEQRQRLFQPYEQADASTARPSRTWASSTPRPRRRPRGSAASSDHRPPVA